jgi:hypothetical protein
MLAIVAATALALVAVSPAEARSGRLSMSAAREAANRAVDQIVRGLRTEGAVDGRVHVCRRRSPRAVDCNYSIYVVDGITCDDVVRLRLRRNGRIADRYPFQEDCYRQDTGGAS